MRAILAVGSTLLFLAGAAVWAQGQGHGQGGGIDPDQLRQMIMRLDTNKDGEIDKAEVPETGLPRFEQMLRVGDANKNGRLERDELQALIERAKAKAKGGGGDKPVEPIAAMDKNGDGKVSREEFTGPAPMFDRVDANKDGFLTPDEVFAALGKAGPKADPTMPPPKPSTGLVPLTDFKGETYQGKQGGLYPGGTNERPSAHEEAGLRLARSIQPLDAKGEPSDLGKIVLLSIGMSNTTQEFSVFKALADASVKKNQK
ncbi:MAG TPA: EF-hand domain-containing protein, partial [Isosphaeraceae bacterium]|nr:EF-hand domain-containing protein [Isosphaeraceae bacterium]